MNNLKNSLEELSEESQDLAKQYLKYVSLSASKKLALLAGILVSTVVLSLFLLLIFILFSFTISGMLNRLLDSEYAGFLIMMGVYLLSFAFVIRNIVKTKTPLFTNLFVKIFAFVFEIESEQKITLDHLDKEKQIVNDKIETDKKLILNNLKLFKYVFIETVITEFLGFFSSKTKNQQNEDEDHE